MNQQIPVWVIVVLIIGIVAVLIVPPWQYKPYSQRGGAKTEFMGWKPIWAAKPPIEGGETAGQPQPWKFHTTYILYEILGVCAVVLVVATVAGRKSASG